jgi:hypothetical protein
MRLFEIAARSWRATRNLAIVLFVALGGTGCQTGAPDGPLFAAATDPGPADALVYIYRTEPLRGVSGVDLELDAQNLGEVQNGEYLSMLVDPGRHVLGARLRWLGIVPRAWNRLEFVAEPGQTVYLRVWAGYQTHPDHPQGARESSGGAPTGSVAVFLSEQKADLAALELPAMRRTSGR